MDAKLFERYKAFRGALNRLLAAAGEYLGRGTLPEAARTLGLWKRGTIVAQTEAALNCVMDYALFDCYAGGRNAAERCVAQSDFPAGSVDAQAAVAVRRAQYRILFFNERNADGTFSVTDLIRKQSLTVVDRAIAQQDAANMLLAGRMVPFETHETFTGATLPLDLPKFEEVLSALSARRLLLRTTSAVGARAKETLAEFSAVCIRQLLLLGTDRHVRYLDADAGDAEPAPASDTQDEAAP